MQIQFLAVSAVLQSCATSSSLLCAATLRTMPAWFAWSAKALDSLLSKIGFVLVPLLGAKNKYAFFSSVTSASSLDVSLICFFQRFIRQHFITQHTLLLHSTTVTDRSESKIQKFLLVETLSHPLMPTEFPIFNNNTCNVMC